MKNKKFNVILFILFAIPVFLFAQDKPTKVTINIKSIESKVPRDVKSNTKISVHDSIRDLRPKLKQIPYRNFDLTSSENFVVPINENQQIALKNGDLLSLQLLYLDSERVGMRMDWKDTQNQQLIDTQLHFDCLETMLVGAEGDDENSGKILAVSVKGKE